MRGWVGPGGQGPVGELKLLGTAGVLGPVSSAAAVPQLDLLVGFFAGHAAGHR